MASPVITYIVLLSAFVVALKSSDKAAAIQSLKFSFLLSTICLLHLILYPSASFGGYHTSSIFIDGSMLLLVFIPASNLYLHNGNERTDKIIDWGYIGRMLEKFVSSIVGYLRFMRGMHITRRKAEMPVQHSPFLTRERALMIEERVKKHFEENKPYLQNGYSLQALSDETQISVHHLSAFINDHYKINFNNFINEHRVVACIQKLLQREWQFKKLEAIALECGFNNRNTFTTAFKKTTGVNPSQFLKQIKLNNFKGTTEYISKELSRFGNIPRIDPLTRENIA